MRKTYNRPSLTTGCADRKTKLRLLRPGARARESVSQRDNGGEANRIQVLQIKRPRSGREVRYRIESGLADAVGSVHIVSCMPCM